MSDEITQINWTLVSEAFSRAYGPGMVERDRIGRAVIAALQEMREQEIVDSVSVMPNWAAREGTPSDAQAQGLFGFELKEKIECAACMFNGGCYFVPRPGRHHHLLRALKSLRILSDAETEEYAEQGFLTDRDRFVDRQAAAEIAYAARQIQESKKTLFSEDMW